MLARKCGFYIRGKQQGLAEDEISMPILMTQTLHEMLVHFADEVRTITKAVYDVEIEPLRVRATQAENIALEQQAEITSLRAELEKAKKDGWISVDTALPDHEQVKQRRVRVLVKWIKTEAVFTLWYGHRFGYNSPSFFEEYEWTESDLGFIDENDNPFLGETLTYSTITHWQPLPDPPKE